MDGRLPVGKLYAVPYLPEDNDGAFERAKAAHERYALNRDKLALAENLIDEIYRISQEDCMYAMLLAEIQSKIEAWHATI